MQLALPVIFLMLIMAVLSGLLVAGPEQRQSPAMATTSAVHRVSDAGPEYP